MPTSDERTVALGRRINPDRDLVREAADFYLLEALGILRGDEWAKARLARHEATLAVEFAQYLDLVIGGELRYAMRDIGRLPREFDPYFAEVSIGQRGQAWLVWTVMRRKLGLVALALAEETFRERGWSRNFGGRAWANIARTLRIYLEGRLPHRVFVDQCFDLQHNTGCVFNKLYDCSALMPVLVAHGCDDYRTLLRACSPEIKNRWAMHEWRARVEHDPIWLGIQMTHSFEHVA